MIALAMACVSWVGTSMPETPSSIISSGPPQRVAITGLPNCDPSRQVCENDFGYREVENYVGILNLAFDIRDKIEELNSMSQIKRYCFFLQPHFQIAIFCEAHIASDKAKAQFRTLSIGQRECVQCRHMALPTYIIS